MFLGVKSSTVSFTSEEVSIYLRALLLVIFLQKFSGEQIPCDTGFEPDSGTTRREPISKLGGKL